MAAKRSRDPASLASTGEAPRTRLDEHLAQFKSVPFLLVGSGLPLRYLGIDNWERLLRRLAEMTSKPFEQYRSDADDDYPTMASLISDEIRAKWWTAPEFKASREAFGSEVATRHGPIKVEVARITGEGSKTLSATSVEYRELQLLRNATIDGVITTNYDALMEDVFPNFYVFVGQDELLMADPQEVGEIYKIHGSATRPESIVLTREDYGEFRARNSYLAAKLLTIFIEHPVIVLGYSMSDQNMMDIVAEIARLMTKRNLPAIRGKLIVVQWQPDAAQMEIAETAMVVDRQLSIPVISVTVPDFLDVFASLTRVVRKFPARSLRRIKEHIHELVLTTDLQGRLYAEPLDLDTDLSRVDVVLGVGVQDQLRARVGYKGIERSDLLRDVLADPSLYDPSLVVSDTLPRLLRGSGRTPVFRYLRAAGLLTEDGQLVASAAVSDGIRRRVTVGRDDYGPTPSARARAGQIAKQADFELTKLLQGWQAWDVSSAIGLLPPEALDLDELRQYIENAGDSTFLAKLVCYYDYLKYGNLALQSTARPKAARPRRPTRSKRREGAAS